MEEAAEILLSVLPVLALVVIFIALPIVALVRTRRIGQLGRHVASLEARLGALEEKAPRGTAKSEPAEKSAAPVKKSRPRLLPPAVEERIQGLRIDLDRATLEAWLGRRGLGWLAVLLLLFATAFFLRYAFENQWIGPMGRVSIGVLAGGALSIGGLWSHRKGWRLFGQMLTAAGVVLLYLATFASFGYYQLLPREHATFFLIALIAEAAALAVLYDAPAIALMAVIGGLLTPVLLSTGRDQYQALFPYLVLLNAGAAGLALFRVWRAVGTVALVGTHFLFWAWYDQHYHPEKLQPALVFQGVLFGLYLAYGILAHVIRDRRAEVEDLVRLVLNACLAATAGYVLLDPNYHVLMGALALGMAVLYTGLGYVVAVRRPQDSRQLLVVVATSMAFIAAAIPLQAKAAWIPVGWAIQGLALWWFGFRIQAEALRILGGVLLALASIGLVAVFLDLTAWDRPPFVPIFNKYGTPGVLVSACVLGAALASRRFTHLGDIDRVAMHAAGLGGVALLFFVLSMETYGFFIARIGHSAYTEYTLGRAAQTALSVLWPIYAGVLLWFGFRLRSEPLRWAALVLFGITLLKVVFVDMAGLPGLYRVLAFFALSLIMGAAAWGYQRFQLTARPAGGR